MDYQYYDEPDYIDDEGGSEDIYPDHETQPDHRYSHNGYYGNADHASIIDRMGDSYANCILPSLAQVLSYLLPLLVGCLLCRLLSALCARQQQLHVVRLHLINAVCGLIVLYVTLGERILLLLLLSGISYMLLQLVRLVMGKGQHGAVTIAVLCIGSQFIYELAIWQQRGDWPQLRGLQMVTNMKVISLAFDMTATGAPGFRMPSVVAYLGYIYNPASCVLGPWLSYTRYLDSLSNKRHWRRSLLQMLCNVLLCLLALTVSNCIAPALSELHLQDEDELEATRRGGTSHWLLMYMGALSVRSSHYFVSFLSQALLAAAGQQLDSTQHGNSKLLGDLVSRPWHIEWPHSLSALVRCWNIPMHEWLKRYVYATSKHRSRHNTIVAVFCTYIVSSLLHGMDLRIYLVLLSLATFAEGETMLRRHLATLSNACVAANPCQAPNVVVMPTVQDSMAGDVSAPGWWR